MAARLRAARPGAPLIWIGEAFAGHEQGALYGPGLALHGLDPEGLVLVQATNAKDALWAMEEALKSRTAAAVIGEIFSTKLYDLTASRRLVLAAQKHGSTGLLCLAGPVARRGAFEQRRNALRNPRPVKPARKLPPAAACPCPAPPPSMCASPRRAPDRTGRSSTATNSIRFCGTLERSPSVTRYLSLFLPSLATDRISRRSGAAPEPPRATVAKVKRAQRLAAVNRAAAAQGLRPGLALADARAIVPALDCCAADAAAEAATLATITDWCRRFTPLAALDPPDGAMLDITGAAHLFGGEAKLRDEIEARLHAQGFAARTAIASTPEAAWAVARFGQDPARTIPAEASEADLRRRLGALPLAALRLDAKPLAHLAQAGLRQIGDLILRPRAPLAARFGTQMFVRLDALLGHAKTPITPRFEAPAFLVERRFAEPIVARAAIAATLLALAGELSRLLARHGEGARRLAVSLFGVDGRVRHLRAGTCRPLRDPAVIARLFHEKIEAAADVDARDPLDAGFGFDLVRLAAEETERQEPNRPNGWLPIPQRSDAIAQPQET